MAISKALQGLHLPHHLAQAPRVIAQRQLLHREDAQLDFIHHVGAEIDRAKGPRAQLPILAKVRLRGGFGGGMCWKYAGWGVEGLGWTSDVLYVLCNKIGNRMKCLRSGIDFEEPVIEGMSERSEATSSLHLWSTSHVFTFRTSSCIPLIIAYSIIPFNLPGSSPISSPP